MDIKQVGGIASTSFDDEPDLGYGTTCRNDSATCDCFVHTKWREQAKEREEKGKK